MADEAIAIKFAEGFEQRLKQVPRPYTDKAVANRKEKEFNDEDIQAAYEAFRKENSRYKIFGKNNG